MPGTYNEAITMKSNVHLQGSGRDVTTIVGGVTVAWGETVTNVAISGFKISGEFRVDGSSTLGQKLTITENYLTGSGSSYGIYLYGCSPYTTVSDNIIAGNTRGIEMRGGCRATIRNNMITGNSYAGIWDGGDSSGLTSDAVIADNVISNNGLYGINTSNNSKLQIRNNDISNNGGSGIYIANASPKVTGNTIANNATDITITSGSANISHNVFDTISGTLTGSYNVKSDGTAW